MRAHLQIEGLIHVHGHGLDATAPLRSQGLEEWPHSRSAAPLANSQHPPAVCVQHHTGVTLALVEGKFVHDQASRLIWRQPLKKRL